MILELVNRDSCWFYDTFLLHYIQINTLRSNAVTLTKISFFQDKIFRARFLGHQNVS